MRFDNSDLQQLTPEYVASLSDERKKELAEQLRVDLLEAHDRLYPDSSDSTQLPNSQNLCVHPGDKQS